MILFLIGPKGAGKTTLLHYLQPMGYDPVSIEAIYDSVDPDRVYSTKNHSEEIVKKVFKIAENLLLEKDNTAYDGTGRCENFYRLYQKIKDSSKPHAIFFIDIARETGWQRSQSRNQTEQRPFTREYFDKNFDEVQKRKELAHYVINNNGSEENFLAEFENILKQLE